MKRNATDQVPESDPPEDTCTPDELREHAIGCVEELYRIFQVESQGLPKEEYSHRRAFLDELTKDIVRIAFIPDEQVEQAFDDYESKLSAKLSFDLFYHATSSIFCYTFPENKQISLALPWELTTLLYHFGYFRSW